MEQNGNQKARISEFARENPAALLIALGGAVLAVLTAIVAAAGFFLIYAGPFAGSGKTLAMYVGRYGAFTLPIFLFPCAAGIIAMWKRKG